MNKHLWFWAGFGIAVLALVGISSYAYWGGSFAADENEGSIAAQTVEEFSETMRSKVIAEIGHPIEGYEPFMFMQVYGGLKAEDFNNVDALIGIYTYKNGEIVYDTQGETELHTAARAISDDGMAQLLFNVAERLNVNLAQDGTLADIFAEIDISLPSNPVGACLEGSGDDCPDNPSIAPGEPYPIVGEMVCLPKPGPGPHTMECAYGLRGDDGNHYGLKNLFHDAGPWSIDIGDRVRIVGTLDDPEPNQIYDIIGVIDVVSAEKI